MKSAIQLFVELLLLITPGAVQAQLTYVTNSGGTTLTITGYAGPPWAVIIPTNINGLEVVNIGEGAFEFVTNMTSVTIPDSVTNIGESAFEFCLNLTSVTLPASVANIGSDAFAGAGLTSVALPAGVTNFGSFAFGCSRLTAITVDPKNAFYSSVGGVVFDKSGFTLIEYPHGGAGSYTVPAGVTNIGGLAFFGCVGLTGVRIPGSVNTIGAAAFALCYGLEDVAIGNGVVNMTGNTFHDCTNLRSITIPESVTAIGPGTFDSCTGLTNLVLPGSITNLEDDSFTLCTNLASIYFQGNAPAASASVFSYDSNATVYFLPGAIGWSNSLAGLPALLWNPVIQTGDRGFGVRNNQFGFNITGTTNIPIAVEACANLAGPAWIPLQALKLTNGSFFFSDPQWTNYPARYYRISSP
jgi:hypothetical protein